MTWEPPSVLADPAGTSTLLSAVLWVQGALLGSVATAIAVLAIAGVGAMMLTGRLDLRRGATVVFGCFLLFGAPGIVAGVRAVPMGDVVGSEPVPANVDLTPPVTIPPRPAVPDDPYAGASIRPR